jgi:hypothetical protein
MGDRRTQARGESLLPGIVEVVLVPEEDHLVAQQRLADLSDRGGVEVAGQLYAIDAGADAAAQLRHGQGGCRRNRHCSGPFIRGVVI